MTKLQSEHTLVHRKGWLNGVIGLTPKFAYVFVPVMLDTTHFLFPESNEPDLRPNWSKSNRRCLAWH